MKKIKQYRDNGAIGALLDEYEKSIEELKETIKDISINQLIEIVDHQTKDKDCRSIQTILSHVVSSGYTYVIEIRKSLGEQINYKSPELLSTIAAYSDALDQMFEYNVKLFEDYPNIKLEAYDPDDKFKVRWGQRYDVEQIIEHAIVHILRHRRQIERFKIIQSNNLPFQNKNYFTQETERLKFRKLTREDIPKWIPFFINNDLLKYVGVDLSKSPETNATEWIEMQLKRYVEQGLGHLAAMTKEGDEFIGVGGIIPRDLEGQKVYEIAYSLIPKFWKKGYGTELAIQMRDFGFQNIQTDRFVSIIDKNNIASINIAKKNGMKIEFETEYLGMNVLVFGIEKSNKK